MRYRKRRSPIKQLTTAIVIALILAVPGVLFGGVVAYLSDSKEISNEFTVENDPVVTVSSDQTSVSVNSPNYPVYVRVKVVANKMGRDGAILPGDYECTLNDSAWFADSDGFWYYMSALNAGTLAPKFDAPADTTINMIAQAVQAVGTTDIGEIPAVEDAWPAVKVVDGKLSKNTP